MTSGILSSFESPNYLSKTDNRLAQVFFTDKTVRDLGFCLQVFAISQPVGCLHRKQGPCGRLVGIR